MKKIGILLIATALLFAANITAFAGDNKGSAKIDKVIPTGENQVVVEYTVDYRDATHLFHLDQNMLVLDLGGSANTLNNAVQADARLKINTEIGPNTITDNNDVRLVAAFVD